jgi:tetratricopeptide (TPR) repeat protein
MRLELDIRFEQAAALHAKGDLGAAASLYRILLGDFPYHPDALVALAVIAQQMGKPELALALIDDAITQRPADASAHYNKGVILRACGRNDEALQAATHAAALNSDLAEAWDLIGQIYKDRGDCTQAAHCLNRAMELQPDNARFHINQALLFLARQDLPSAYASALKAEQLDPDSPPHVLGNVLKAMGYPELAAPRFARARQLRPHFTEAAASEAMARLQMGEFEQGWALWEQRPDMEPDAQEIPLWHGENVDHLLIYEDQGLGDAIQFARYLPMVRDQARQITLRLRAPLHRLFKESFPWLSIIDETTLPPPVEVRCRLSSLPALFKADLGNIPTASYMKAPASLVGAGDGPFPRIGLVWAGNSAFLNDSARSFGFSHLQPLLDLGASHFVSLQLNRPAEQRAIQASGIFDATPQLADFAATAAVIETLDLVISVDTATAHLAGSLGKPIWILLPFDSDWRWLIGREDSPWYPTARLFRQTRMGEWESVIARVIDQTRHLIAGDRSVLSPSRWRGECLRQNPDALSLPP